MSLRRLFGGEVPFDVASYPTPTCPDDHPKYKGKNIRRNKKAPTTKHSNNCASTLTLKGCLRHVTMIPHPGFGCIVTLDLGVVPKIQQYMITIGSFPNCSCPYFKEMVTKALGSGKITSICTLSSHSSMALILTWMTSCMLLVLALMK
jgi:hypothetical protein